MAVFRGRNYTSFELFLICLLTNSKPWCYNVNRSILQVSINKSRSFGRGITPLYRFFSCQHHQFLLIGYGLRFVKQKISTSLNGEVLFLLICRRTCPSGEEAVGRPSLARLAISKSAVRGYCEAEQARSQVLPLWSAGQVKPPAPLFRLSGRAQRAYCRF